MVTGHTGLPCSHHHPDPWCISNNVTTQRRELILMTADLVDYNCRSVAQSLINDRSVVFHKFRTDNLSVAYRGSWITANVLIHNYLCCMRDGTDVLIIDTCRGQLVSSLWPVSTIVTGTLVPGTVDMRDDNAVTLLLSIVVTPYIPTNLSGLSLQF